MAATKTIALTGGTGFIGQHIIHQAGLMGFHVRALCRQPQTEKPGVTWVEGDLNKPDTLTALLRDVDAVIHTAGLVKALNFKQFEQANVVGSENLAHAILEQSSENQIHTVHFSSLAARSPCLSHYARSKNLSEQFLTSILEQSKNTPLTILRPPAVYGPKDKELLPIIKSISKGILPIPASRENKFSMIFAADLARAALYCIEKTEAFGQVYELDDGKPHGYTMGEFGEVAAQIFGNQPKEILIPAWVLKTIGIFGNISAFITRKPSMLTSLKANEINHPNWVCTNNLLNQSNFWQAEVCLEQGLKQSIDWYKEQSLL